MPDQFKTNVLATFESYFTEKLEPFLADPEAIRLMSEVDAIDSCEVAIASIELEDIQQEDECVIGRVEMFAHLLVNNRYAVYLGLKFEDIELLESTNDPLYPQIKQAVNQNLFESVMQG
ncbi:MAG: hypothetical protein ACRCWD_03600 [Culicoidibacterales bacterium]